MDASIKLNSSIESTIEKEKSESTLFDMAIFNLSKGKRKVLQVLLKALGIEFKENVLVPSTQESPYNSEFMEKIKRGREDIKAGRMHRVAIEDIDKLEAWQ